MRIRTTRKKKLRRVLPMLLLLPCSLAGRAQSFAPDSSRAPGLVQRADTATPARASRLARIWACPTVRRVLPPAALITAGALTTRKMGLVDSDEEFREEVREHVPAVQTTIDDELRYVPAYASLGLSLLGVKGRHGSGEQAILFALSYTLNNTIVSHLKNLTQVQRPNGTGYSSFPSQHTSAAFASATLLRKEYGHRSIWYSVGGYSVATATAALRLAKDNHWLSDVLAGAGVGIASTELTYLAYPLLQKAAQKLLPHRKAAGAGRTVVMPYYTGTTAGLALVLLR
jgi:hypothetical protein